MMHEGRAVMSTTRAALYCRVSTDAQKREGTSLETQEAACRQYAEDHGFSVTEAYRDTYSGAELYARPAMTRLRNDAQQGAFDAVILYAVDRLARHQAHIHILVDEFKRAGVQIEFVTEKFE